MDKKDNLQNVPYLLKTSRFSFFKKFFSKKKNIIAIFLVVISFGGYYFYQSTQNPLADAETFIVKSTTLKDELSLSGTVEAEERIDLHFQTGGRVTWVGVKEGEEVKKNQGIASLDQRQLQKNIEKFLNTYDKQRRTFEQTNEDNSDEKISSSSEIREKARRALENAQFDLNNSVLDVELQTIAKEYSYLYTPIAGIVTRADISTAGLNATPQDIFQIVNKESIYFSLSVDQTEIVSLREGMQGEVMIDAFPDQKFTGTVQSLGFTPKTNETGTVYEVKIKLSGGSVDLLRLGMTGDITFVVEEHPNVLSVPVNFVNVDEDDTTFVNVLVNGKTQKRTVQTDLEVGEDIEIVSGLGEGETVVIVEE